MCIEDQKNKYYISEWRYLCEEGDKLRKGLLNKKKWRLNGFENSKLFREQMTKITDEIENITKRMHHERKFSVTIKSLLILHFRMIKDGISEFYSAT